MLRSLRLHVATRGPQVARRSAGRRAVVSTFLRSSSDGSRTPRRGRRALRCERHGLRSRVGTHVIDGLWLLGLRRFHHALDVSLRDRGGIGPRRACPPTLSTGAYVSPTRLGAHRLLGLRLRESARRAEPPLPLSEPVYVVRGEREHAVLRPVPDRRRARAALHHGARSDDPTRGGRASALVRHRRSGGAPLCRKPRGLSPGGARCLGSASREPRHRVHYPRRRRHRPRRRALGALTGTQVLDRDRRDRRHSHPAHPLPRPERGTNAEKLRHLQRGAGILPLRSRAAPRDHVEPPASLLSRRAHRHRRRPADRPVSPVEDQRQDRCLERTGRRRDPAPARPPSLPRHRCPEGCGGRLGQWHDGRRGSEAPGGVGGRVRDRACGHRRLALLRARQRKTARRRPGPPRHGRRAKRAPSRRRILRPHRVRALESVAHGRREPLHPRVFRGSRRSG